MYLVWLTQFIVHVSVILRDKTMDNTLMYIVHPEYDKQNKPFVDFINRWKRLGTASLYNPIKIR